MLGAPQLRSGSAQLPGLLAQPDVTGLAGPLHLHGTDGPGKWQADLGARAGGTAGARPAVADTTIEGTRSDLLLWLTNRGPAPSIRVAGQPSVAAAWAQLRR